MENKTFNDLLIGVGIIFLPLFNKFAKVDLALISKVIALCGLFVVFSAMRGERARTAPRSLILFVLYLAGITVLNTFKPDSWHVNYQSLIIFCSIPFAVSFYETFSSETVKVIKNAMSISCIIQLLIIFSTYLGFNLYYDVIAPMINLFYGNGPAQFVTVLEDYKATGSLVNPNISGAFLAITGASLLRRQWAYALPFLMVALFKTESIWPLVTFGAISVFQLNRYFNVQKYLYIGAIGLKLIVLLGLFSAYSSYRNIIWNFSLSLVDNPIFGMGPGWFYHLGIKFNEDQSHMIREHNDYLALFNYGGFIAVICLFFILYKCSMSKSDHVIKAAFFGCVISAIAHFPMYVAPTALLCIVLGLVTLRGAYYGE